MTLELPDEFHFLMPHHQNLISHDQDSAAFREYARNYIGSIYRAQKVLGRAYDFRSLLHAAERLERVFWDYCEVLLEAPATFERLKSTELGLWKRQRDDLIISLKQRKVDTGAITDFYLTLYQRSGVNDQVGDELIRYLNVDAHFRAKVNDFVFGVRNVIG